MFITVLLKLYFAIFFTLFLPGLILIHFFENRFNLRKINLLEKLVLSFGLSLTSVNFLTMLLNRLNIPINPYSLFLTIILFSAVFWGLTGKIKNETALVKNKELSRKNIFSYLKTNRLTVLFLLVFIFSLLPRIFYVAEGIFPKATDLGHHLYWSQIIIDTGKLADYDGRPDFIIGEHIIFSAISLLSGINLISSFPTIVLLLINLFSCLALAILAFRFTCFFQKKQTGWLVAILTLIIVGIFYPIGDPQAKYVSGGVIGNLMGNLFIPLIFWSLLQTFSTQRSIFAFLFFLLSANLAYTHHLSTFVLLYSLSGFILTTLLLTIFFNNFNFKKSVLVLWKKIKPFFTIPNLGFLILMGLFVFLVWTPSYLNFSAIDRAVGSPIKATRTGLGFGQIILSVGPWRFFYGGLTLGIILFFLLYQKFSRHLSTKINPTALIFNAWIIAWAGIILAMSTYPRYLKVDIPSNRVVTYLAFPFVLLSALGVFIILQTTRKFLPSTVYVILFLTLIGTGFISGLSDLSNQARGKNTDALAAETYASAQYLAPRVTDNEMVLKDHIYLAGDTWLKHFFHRGYDYPISRTFNFRYEDIMKKRETCTRDMVLKPNSEIGKQCFAQTNTRYIILKDGSDTAQFERSNNFQKVYSSNNVVIFQRNN